MFSSWFQIKNSKKSPKTQAAPRPTLPRIARQSMPTPVGVSLRTNVRAGGLRWNHNENGA